jgi:hypothetical protein
VPGPPEPPPAFATFLGVDFSAAKDGGRRTWIAEAVPRPDGGLAVSCLQRAADLPDSGPDPAAFLPALAAHLLGRDNALAGLDFPFTLPEALMPEPDWPAFAAGFAARFPDPDRFRRACTSATGGRELKRRCDREARTPFAAYNLRLYRQSWWGIARLLAPLAADPRVSVLPMQVRAGATVSLAEICPASTLKQLGLSGSYKGRTEAKAAQRAAILARLGAAGLALSAAHGQTALDDRGGDALDALIACTAAWRTAHACPQALFACRDETDRREGRVYV